MRRRSGMAFLLAALLGGGCAGNPPAPETSAAPPPAEPIAAPAEAVAPAATAPFSVSVEAARVALGGDIVFHVTLANRGPAPADLAVPRIDVHGLKLTVRRADGTSVRLERTHGTLGARAEILPDTPPTRRLGPGESFTTDVSVVAVQTGRFGFSLTYEPLHATVDAGDVEVVAPDPSKARLGVVFDTTHGSYTAVLRPDLAFNTVENFASLVKSRLYDGTKFHRVIAGYMAQGGDPIGTGAGGPGYYIPLEANRWLLHERGVLSMARTVNPDTGGSQFFIMFAASHSLDGQYATFGQMVEGEAALARFEAIPVGKSEIGEVSAPKEPVGIQSARLVLLK